jgi:hypothetical protein
VTLLDRATPTSPPRLKTAATWTPAVALGLWAIGWYVGFAHHGGLSWHFFTWGGRSLTALHDQVHGGLHVYAAYPILQIGPLALLAAAFLMHATPDAGLVAGQLAGVAAGAVLLWQVYAVARVERPNLARHRLMATAVPFVPVWMYVAVRSEHLDDVLALLCATLALRAGRSERAVACGVLIGLSIDAKPWALPFACLALLLTDRRDQIRAGVAAAAVAALGWLPFLLGDPRTASQLSHYTIANSPLSALRVLGIVDPRTPLWDRPAQAALGVVLAMLAIRRGRWPAVILLVVVARIVLDPGANRYYTAGVAVGALLWDVLGSRSNLPWWSTGTVFGVFASRWVPMSGPVHGWLTLGLFVVTAAAFALAPVPARPDPAAYPAVPEPVLRR